MSSTGWAPLFITQIRSVSAAVRPRADAPPRRPTQRRGARAHAMRLSCSVARSLLLPSAKTVSVSVLQLILRYSGVVRARTSYVRGGGAPVDAADHELDGQRHAGRRRVGDVDDPGQRIGGRVAEACLVLSHRRQGRLHECGELDVVEADERHVGGHGAPCAPEPPASRRGHEVAGGEHGRRRLGEVEQPAHRGIARLRVEVALLHVLVPVAQAEVLELGAVAEQAVRAGASSPSGRR